MGLCTLYTHFLEHLSEGNISSIILNEHRKVEKRLFGFLSRTAMFVYERLGYNLNILGNFFLGKPRILEKAKE